MFRHSMASSRIAISKCCAKVVSIKLPWAPESIRAVVGTFVDACICHVSLSPLFYFILFSFYSISIISPFYYFLFFGVSLPAYVLPYYAAYILLLFTWHKHALFHSISYIIFSFYFVVSRAYRDSQWFVIDARACRR